ncbi:hypothetical protein Ciccas_010187 [Cichlidogyrus casuarinus]|uniref:G-protein coupled receptors family 1 profile domain-containing protein n=1 Tax=Cichlidogyrus casuarinus TaxID=1844966 RepID=A0ABD2PUV6_9PLAT
MYEMLDLNKSLTIPWIRTNQPQIQIRRTTQAVVVAVLVIFGITALILTFYAVHKNQRIWRSASQVYLLSLGTVDFITLVFLGTSSIYLFHGEDEQVVKIAQSLHHWAIISLIMASNWILTIQSLERVWVVAGRSSFGPKPVMTKKQRIIIVIFLVTFSALLIIPMSAKHINEQIIVDKSSDDLLGEYESNPDTWKSENSTNKTLDLNFRKNTEEHIVFRIYLWAVFFFIQFLIPLIVIMITSYHLLKCVRQTRKLLPKLQNPVLKQNSRISKEELTVTVSILCLNLAFVICQGQFSLYTAIQKIILNNMESRAFQIFSLMSIVILALKSDFSLLLNWWLSERFSRTLKRLVHRMTTMNVVNNNSSSIDPNIMTNTRIPGEMTSPNKFSTLKKVNRRRPFLRNRFFLRRDKRSNSSSDGCGSPNCDARCQGLPKPPFEIRLTEKPRPLVDCDGSGQPVYQLVVKHPYQMESDCQNQNVQLHVCSLQQYFPWKKDDYEAKIVNPLSKPRKRGIFSRWHKKHCKKRSTNNTNRERIELCKDSSINNKNSTYTSLMPSKLARNSPVSPFSRDST